MNKEVKESVSRKPFLCCDTALRSRLRCALLLFAAVAAGLLSRHFSDRLPDFVFEYLGDVLWAASFYFLFAIIFRSLTSTGIALITGLFALLIELYQLPELKIIDFSSLWKPLAYIFGYGFKWTDLLCYAAGISLGLLLERWFCRLKKAVE